MGQVSRLQKDADRTVAHTYTGDENISAASAITWAMLPSNVDWSGDLDTVITDEALVTKTLGAAEIVITDGAAGEFTVAIDAADTAGLRPGPYLVLVRITLAGAELGPSATPIQLIAQQSP